MACRMGRIYDRKYTIGYPKSYGGGSKAAGIRPSVGRKSPRQGATASFDGRNGCQKCFCVTFNESNKAYSLLTQFMPAAIVYSTEEETTFIEKRTIDTVSEFYKVMYYSESYGKSEQEKLYLRILMITDYISGMTDNYAKKLYRELFI